MTFREAKEQLLYTFSENLINDEDFVFLYDLNTSKDRDFHYWECDLFDLDTISKDANFRFLKNEIRKLGAVLRLKNETVCNFYIIFTIIFISIKSKHCPFYSNDKHTQTDIQI